MEKCKDWYWFICNDPLIRLFRNSPQGKQRQTAKPWLVQACPKELFKGRKTGKIAKHNGPV